jgi:hypothetical protein
MAQTLLEERFGRRWEAGMDRGPPAIVHWPLKGTKLRPAQPYGNEAFRKRFPQASARLSKANVEI